MFDRLIVFGRNLEACSRYSPALLTNADVDVAGPRIYRPEEIEEEKISAVIGQGRFGKVRRAKLIDKEKRSSVAVKRSQTADLASERQELYAFATPSPHANIVRFKGVVYGRDYIDFVMELAEGGNLEELLLDKARADALRPSPKLCFFMAC